MPWTCPRCHADYTSELDRCEADGAKLVQNLAGQTINDRYFLEKLIGVGGMHGTIWRALQRATNRPVAVKVLPAANAEEAQRFERGARIASNLNHPHITTIHDYGTTTDGMFYLVMEFLEGDTLQHMLRHQSLGLKDVLVITDQILRGLEHAHALNVVHRDLKPSNLFVTRKNDDIYFVKILDFGLAKLASTGTESADDEIAVDADGGGEVTPASIATGLLDMNDITQARRICGTPEYMAPEQILGGPLDRRTDIYALGVILYRMLAGHMPFRARLRHELYHQHLSHTPPPILGEVPEGLVRVAMKALAKRPTDRFTDASEMRSALRSADRGLSETLGGSFTGAFPSDASSTRASERPSVPRSLLLSAAEMRPEPRWRKRALVAAGVAALALVLVFALRGGGDATPLSAAAVIPPQSVAPSPPRVEPQPHLASTVAGAAARAVAEAPRGGTLALSSVPSGAEVVRDGSVVGITPARIALPAGNHTLIVRRSGHEPSVVSADVAAGGESAIEVTLMVAGEAPALPPVEPGADAELEAAGNEADRPALARVERRRSGGRPARNGEAASKARGVPVPDVKPDATPADKAPTVLGGVVPRPTADPVMVLGRDLKQNEPKVKILGPDERAPLPPVKVLGQ